jgi:ComF family protein
MGAAIARRWSRAGVGAEVVVNVPVHADRERVRGYDQAALIARAAARHLDLPFSPMLERQRATIAQFDLDRRDRAANVAGAFGVRANDGWTPAMLAGRWVLVVDDVTTTGATLAACATALEAAGALAVSAITVARER